MKYRCSLLACNKFFFAAKSQRRESSQGLKDCLLYNLIILVSHASENFFAIFETLRLSGKKLELKKARRNARLICYLVGFLDTLDGTANRTRGLHGNILPVYHFVHGFS